MAFDEADEKEEKKAEGPVNFEESIYNWSRTMAEIFNLANQKHYNVANPEKCMISSIDSFITNLDPHSSFMDPETYKTIQEMTSGEFFGIGVVIDNTRQTKDKFLVIIDTIPGGPSDKAGIKPLDKIIAINDEPLEGMSTDKATLKLRGERLTKIKVTVVRENYPEPISFDIERDVVQEQNSLCFYVKDQNVYYLSLSMFTENSIKQIADLLKKATQKKSKGLILDLRNNSGGLLNAAIDIAGLFVEKGSIVVTTKDKNNKEVDKYHTKSAPIADGSLPIFILINNYTASAGEILAGVLKMHSQALSVKSGKKEQDRLMVFLVGTRTYGKGSVQEVIPVSNNCAVKITTSLFYLPDGTTNQGVGIEPDFEIERKFPPSEQMLWLNKFFGRERSLNNYIKPCGLDQKGLEEAEKKEKERKAEKDKKQKNWTERSREMLSADNQFRETITLINILSTAKECCPAQIRNREAAIQFLKKNYVTGEQLTLEEVKV
jgi:carboxyl-terminal processing protease